MTTAIKFGKALSYEFGNRSSSAGFGELAQFRALQGAFGALAPRFHVEEYHGSKRQVYFDTTQSWLRPRARCELCDLLLITYSTTGPLQARLMLLQAKLSRSKHVDPCSMHRIHSHPIEFKGNFEQWDLLSARPLVFPTGVFTPPPDLLQKAIVPSIGAFGIFHRKASGTIDMFYASADALNPVGTPSTKNGKLSTTVGSSYRNFSGFIDQPMCCCLQTFGESIFRLHMGAPIRSTDASGNQTNHEPLLSFVKEVLVSLIHVVDTDSLLASELLSLLGDSTDHIGMNRLIPNVVILKGETEDDYKE